MISLIIFLGSALIKSMADFQFLKSTHSKQWVISAPRRAKRPNVGKRKEITCPFCIGNEQQEVEVFRIGGETGDTNWKVRVIKNKFAFAPVHEIIIHSPDHHKNFDELPLEHIVLILKTYKERYNIYKKRGQIYIS